MHFGDSLDGSDLGSDGFSDLQGRRAQRLRARKKWNSEIPEFDLGRLFDDYAGQHEAGITALKTFQHTMGKTMFQVTIQAAL